MRRGLDYQTCPACRIGDRVFIIIARRTCLQWADGGIGNCTPVALVALEHESCTVWQLQGNLSQEELQRVLCNVTVASPRPDSFAGSRS